MTISDKPVKLKYRDTPGQIVLAPFIEGYAHDETVDWSKLGHYAPIVGRGGLVKVKVGGDEMTLWYKRETLGCLNRCPIAYSPMPRCRRFTSGG